MKEPGTVGSHREALTHSWFRHGSLLFQELRANSTCLQDVRSPHLPNGRLDPRQHTSAPGSWQGCFLHPVIHGAHSPSPASGAQTSLPA